MHHVLSIALMVVPAALSAAPDAEVPEELRAELAAVVGDAPVVKETDPVIALGVGALMLAHNTAVAAVNLRAERGRWPGALAELGEVASYRFDTERFCAWTARERADTGLEFESVARDAAGACGPVVRGQLSAVDAAAGLWRYDILQGPRIAAADARQVQIIEMLQAVLTGRTIRSGRQAPRVERHDFAVPLKN